MQPFLLAGFATLLRLVAIDCARTAAHRFATSILLGLGAALAGLAAILCLLAALWLSLLPSYGPIAATLLVGGLLVLVMLALLLAIWLNSRGNFTVPVVIPIPSPIPAWSAANVRPAVADLVSAAVAGFMVGLLRAPARTDGE